MLEGMIARPRATSERTNSGVTKGGHESPKPPPLRQRRLCAFEHLPAAEIFPLRDVDHLAGDHAGAGPFELGHRLAIGGAHGAMRRGEAAGSMLAAHSAGVLGRHAAA